MTAKVLFNVIIIKSHYFWPPKKAGIFEFLEFLKVVAYDSTIGPHNCLDETCPCVGCCFMKNKQWLHSLEGPGDQKICITHFSDGWWPDYWHVGQVEGYLGQVRRSKTKIPNPYWHNVLDKYLVRFGTDGSVKEVVQGYNFREYEAGCFHNIWVCFFFRFTIGLIVIYQSIKS